MQKIIHREKTKVIKNRKISKGFFKLTLLCEKIASLASPGEFVDIKVSDNLKPLLRRPISIHNAKGKQIELLYKIVGDGTRALSQRKTGEHLDIIGPLGKGFNYPELPTLNSQQILVAGGMGVAPLLFLAERLARGKILVLIGARTKSEIACEKEFNKLGCDVKIATDDGSCGHKGKVTELLEKILRAHELMSLRVNIYACGPRPMLKEISRISKKYKFPAEISLEEHMACGIGACLGCVINTSQGYKRACKEGPVFDAQDIVW